MTTITTKKKAVAKSRKRIMTIAFSIDYTLDIDLESQIKVINEAIKVHNEIGADGEDPEVPMPLLAMDITDEDLADAMLWYGERYVTWNSDKDMTSYSPAEKIVRYLEEDEWFYEDEKVKHIKKMDISVT
jgi:hypothetical protein